MVLWLASQVLEDRLLPVSFHVIPVVNLTMPNRIVHAVSRCLGVRECFISDKEIEVFDTALGREAAGFAGDGWTAATGLRSGSTSGNGGREHAVDNNL